MENYPLSSNKKCANNFGDTENQLIKEYETRYLSDNGSINNRLTDFINSYAENGFVLHSIIPYLEEGTTKGYTLVFELEVDEDYIIFTKADSYETAFYYAIILALQNP
ncbi:hypothetical protein DCE79_05805 [Lysinibacillus sp. 2017]|uniref:DUF4177 domain-containing protein n=1 Tax=unclassified Lysinibacillus TaxID=2636778 RepID=UPI000D528C77|nr:MULTISPECIES: DUF4177 domain-containing protein [unclassified Lysinibacillus]AWE06942.1 hypothetical protein DCE79_05805 [Lysinibacillus sp. 2017]TGN37131.1 DUF4177 domain-containing protein [Lysinibacillus sp. S2017]